MFHALRTIATTEAGGARALYFGWRITALRAGLVASAELATYDSTKVFILERNILGPIWGGGEGVRAHIVAGFIAACAGTFVSSPADLIKTRYRIFFLGC